MPIATVNPATGETVRTFVPFDDARIEGCLALAHSAARSWREVPLAARTRVLARAGEIMDAERDALGALMTLEMGKPLRAAVDEAAKCATAFRYYAEHAARFLAPEIARDDADGRDYVMFQPLGVVLAVMPWNFPFWQVVRFAAPALAAGNTALLKHSSNVPQCALAIEDILRRAGAPLGVFQTLLVESAAVEALLADARVAAATLTGSEAAGRAVASQAGVSIKKTVLELGGSDPLVVMPSADIVRAAETAVKSRNINNGQSCIAAKRFIVHDDVADEFERLVVAGVRALRVGDPRSPDTDIGPLATPKIAGDVDALVRDAEANGARLLIGGRRLSHMGECWFAPGVLADVPPSARAYREELFGPVALLFRVRDREHAVQVANDTPFGLGAAVWTRDEAEAEWFAGQLDAGAVFVNGMVASDPRFPFGGIKHSGYGRELGVYGLREFVNVKTVRMARGAGTSGAVPNTE